MQTAAVSEQAVPTANFSNTPESPAVTGATPEPTLSGNSQQQTPTPIPPSSPNQEKETASSTLPAGITFSCGWEDKEDVTPGNKWVGKQAVDEERFYRDTEYARLGQYSIRVEVQPGDVPSNAGTSGERAEVYDMLGENSQSIYENEFSGKQYYAFSVRLDSDWQPLPIVDDKRWGIILQLHGPNDLNTSPAFSFNAVDEFYIYLHSGDLVSRESPYFVGDAFRLSDGSLNVGHWVDFIIEIVYSKYPRGSIVIWRRDEGKADFTEVLNLKNIPTLQYHPKENNGIVRDHYWKHGYYRPIGSNITNILWLDSLTRGISFERVARQAFNTKSNLYINRAFLPFTKLN